MTVGEQTAEPGPSEGAAEGAADAENGGDSPPLPEGEEDRPETLCGVQIVDEMMRHGRGPFCVSHCVFCFV